MTDDHWAMTLYRRYVELYGDAIEEPVPPAMNKTLPDAK